MAKLTQFQRQLVKDLYLSNGNKKLKNTDKVRFIIWNLPAVITCPFRTPHCEGKCYARKAEKFYKDALPRRMKNFELSLKEDFVISMIEKIERRLKSKTYRDTLTVFRIHESGDFYNKVYAMKWLEIARYFDGKYNIVFMAYTKSLPFFEGEKLPSNFVLRSSIWDDTKKNTL